ncbi:MAG: hypothetical protein R3335_14005, partial [Anaerolineales bacterium]|nr:hypothetical protein [Anaerolineales bacterium]
MTALSVLILWLLVACNPADPAGPGGTDPYPIETQAAQGAYPSPSISLPPPLRSAEGQEPASGICAEPGGEIVEITLTSDGPASPRCVKVTGDQRLRFINSRAVPVELSFGPFSETISPGGGALFDRNVGEYLASGVHQVEGAEIMLLASEAYPPPAG